jgi:hypothetical protein
MPVMTNASQPNVELLQKFYEKSLLEGIRTRSTISGLSWPTT